MFYLLKPFQRISAMIIPETINNPPIQPLVLSDSAAISQANNDAKTGSMENTSAVRVAVVNRCIDVCMRNV